MAWLGVVWSLGYGCEVLMLAVDNGKSTKSWRSSGSKIWWLCLERIVFGDDDVVEREGEWAVGGDEQSEDKDKEELLEKKVRRRDMRQTWLGAHGRSELRLR